jgi:hypothetical protein
MEFAVFVSSFYSNGSHPPGFEKSDCYLLVRIMPVEIFFPNLNV